MRQARAAPAEPPPTLRRWVTALYLYIYIEKTSARLAAQGLIAAHAAPLHAVAAQASSGSLSDALAHLGYDELYTLLTSQARDRLGLIGGYRFVLEVEKAGGVEDLRKLAERFLTLVKQHQGEAAERQMRVVLCAAM